MCKWWAPRLAVEAINDCIVLRGDVGWSLEMPLQQMLLDVSGLQIGDGTPQIQKLVIARESQPSKVTVASAATSSRSARSSNFTTVRGADPSAAHRQTRSLSGLNSAFRKACSSRNVLTDPQAISRSTWTSTSVVPAWWNPLLAHSNSGRRPPSTTNSGRAP